MDSLSASSSLLLFFKLVKDFLTIIADDDDDDDTFELIGLIVDISFVDGLAFKIST